MSDVNISKYRAQVIRQGSTPASPGFAVAEGQNPVDPSGSGQNHLPVTIGSPANGLAVTDAQVLTIDKAQIFAGTSSQFVKGDGTLDSTAYGSGTVTSVSALTLGTTGTDLTSTVANGTTTPVITLNVPTASAVNRGALSAADWTTFNSKQDAITLTTTGTSGASTLVGATLNIPNYADQFVGTVTSVAATAGTGISVSGSPITTSGTLTITNTAPDQVVALTASTGISVSGTYPSFTITNTSPSSGGTVTSVGLSSATSGVTIGSTPITTSGIITIAIATGTASQNGLLSSSDWTTFNSKQNALTNPVTGTGTTNYLPKFTGSTTIGNSLFTDDGTNGAFGGANYSSGTSVRTFNISAPLYAGLGFWANNILSGDIFSYTVTGNLLINADPTNVFTGTKIGLSTDGTERLAVFSNGNVTIANSPTDAGFKLDVAGTGRFTSSLTVGGTQYLVNTSTGTNQTYQRILNTGGDVVIGINANTGAALASGGLAYATAIYNNSNTALQFGTNAAFNMTIAAGGNVLIGTTTDNGARLQVSGAATFSSSVTAGGEFTSTMGNNTRIFFSNTATTGYQYLSLLNNTAHTIFGIEGTAAGSLLTGGTANASVFTTVGNTNLEFGTNQVKRLTIAASTGAATFSSSVTCSLGTGGANFDCNAATTGALNGYRASNSVGVGSYGIEANAGGQLMTGGLANATLLQSISNTALQFGTNQTARVTITNDGKVGIGTSSPTREMVLYRSSGEVHFKLANGTTGESSVDGFDMAIDSSGGAYLIQRENQPMHFFTNSTERMRITSSGNVGIGTSSPSQALSIGDGTSNKYIRVQGITCDSYYGSDSLGTFIGNISSAPIYINTNGVERMRITSGGNVLIGTTTDAGYKLIVNGNAYISTDLDVVGDAFFGSTLGATLLNVNGTSILCGTGGNALIGTTTDVGAKLYVNGAIQTAAPSGGYARKWKLGNAYTGTVTANRLIRVEVDGVAYDIVARE